MNGSLLRRAARFGVATICAAICAACATPHATPASVDAAAPDRPLIWTVTGPQGALTLAGSVHALRAADHPLPAAYDAAYARSTRLVLEVELDGADAAREIGPALAAGRLPRGTTLREVLGAERWAEAERLAALAAVDLSVVEPMEPWLATLALVDMAWRAHGMASARGLDQHYLERARADGKQVLGLERVVDQFALFDALPPAEQAHQFIETLRELPTVEPELDAMIAAWRRGDLTAWDKSFAELDASPVLRRSLLDERHARWLPQLERMLAEPTATLVIVGTLHLVGKESLVAELARRGYRVERGAAQ